MRSIVTTAVAAGFLLLAPVASHADLAAYTQNFEGLVMADPGALSANGWKIFANVFSPDHSVYYYGYGVFPAPNGGNGFSAIDAGQGGAAQGAQQLSIYNDYNNADHAAGNQIEANVFQEQVVGAADVGSQWTFRFDAKLGNLVAPTTAVAFIKTLNPSAGYAMTNFVTYDTASLPASWGTFAISLNIDPSLVGQILQFGFMNTASNYVGSGVFYDNLSFFNDTATPATSTSWGKLKSLYR